MTTQVRIENITTATEPHDVEVTVGSNTPVVLAKGEKHEAYVYAGQEIVVKELALKKD